MTDGKVRVTRMWNTLQIKTIVSREGIEIELGLPMFVEALKQEIRLPPLKFQSKKAQEEKEVALKVSIENAVQRILERMKAETAQAPHR